MTRYEDQVRDEYGVPVPGAEAWVYTLDGVLVDTLSDLDGTPLANPITTDNDGIFYFFVADGQYSLDIRYGGKLEYRQIILVGYLAVENGKITTIKLANGAVTNPKLADGAVTAVKIADGEVSTAKVADRSVLPGKLFSVLTNMVLWRRSSGAGDIEAVPFSQLKADLGNGDWNVTGNVIGANLVGSLIVARPAVGSPEGGQMVFGYVGKSDMVAGVNGCWTTDVSNLNDFRIFRVGLTGEVIVPFIITESTGTATFAFPVFVPNDPYGPGWNGNMTVPTKDAIYDKIEALMLGGFAATAAGVSAVDSFEYAYNTATTEPPAASQLRFNNAAAASVTKIWITTVTSMGNDPSLYFAALALGDNLVTQRKNDATAFRRYDVTGPAIAKSGYLEIPVAFIEQGPTALTGGQATMIGIVQPAAAPAIADHPSDATVNAILAALRRARVIQP